MSVQVAITGGTGFIGKHLLDALLNAGLNVKSLARRAYANTSRLTWIRGSLADENALQELCRDCAALIHCAGVVRGNNLDDFLTSNLHGTRNLVAAIQSQQQPIRLLLISSLAARYPELSWYAHSKFAAEQSLQTATLKLPATIFRPTAVYGAGDKEMQALFKGMKQGFLFAPANVNPRISILHVEDLVKAILLWLENEAVNGLYELDDGTENGFDWEAFTTIGEHVWQRKIKTLYIPVVLLQIVARINLLSARLLHYKAMLSPGKINEITHPDWVCDNTKLTQQTGWTAKIKLIDAIDAATEKY